MLQTARSYLQQLKARVFYGWWMVGSAFGIQIMQSCMLHQSIGAYVAVLQDDMKWSKTALSGAAVIQQVESAILAPIQGWIIDRFGPQWMIRCGIVLLGVGFLVLSQVETLSGFYGAFVLVALGSGLSGFFPLTVSLVNWFERKRARALSFMQSGYAAGGIAIPIVAWSLQSFGWRATAFTSGILVLLIGLPLAMVIRRRPEDHGEVVDGMDERLPATSASQATARRPSRDFTAREALRTPAFWFVSVGHGSSLFVVSAVLVHAINHMKEGLGYSLATASFVMSLMTLCQFTGILVSGFIGDRFDKRFPAAACMFFHMVGMLLLTYATSLFMVLAFAILHGLSWGMRGPLMQSIRADYFGRSSIGLIIGLSSMIVLIDQISGPLIAGILADQTGNYRLGFTILALLSGLGSVFFLLAKKPVSPE